jgi:hypothetical protein
MSPLSDTPRPFLFGFERSPEPMIVVKGKDHFSKDAQRVLTRKLEEYAAKRPEIQQLPPTDVLRIMFDIKTAIICELWSRGKISVKNFGKTPGKPDKFDPAQLQDAFTEIINELDVDL